MGEGGKSSFCGHNSIVPNNSLAAQFVSCKDTGQVEHWTKQLFATLKKQLVHLSPYKGMARPLPFKGFKRLGLHVASVEQCAYHSGTLLDAVEIGNQHFIIKSD